MLNNIQKNSIGKRFNAEARNEVGIFFGGSFKIIGVEGTGEHEDFNFFLLIERVGNCA